jgi:DNA repair protein RadD
VWPTARALRAIGPLKMSIVLRPQYQAPNYAAIQNAWLTVQNVLYVAPCRSGKTVVMAKAIADNPYPSLVLAHRGELIAQLSMTLARLGIYHKIIGTDSLARACGQNHVREFGKNFISTRARCYLASAQTLMRCEPEPWMAEVRLWMADECFPAGTMVSGRPIESLQIGDIVDAFDEVTQSVMPRAITHVFRNPMPKTMVRVCVREHHVLDCTSGHPFYTKSGWKAAAELTTDDEVLLYEERADMCGLRQSGKCGGTGLVSSKHICKDGTRHTPWGMQTDISFAGIVEDSNCHQFETCVCANGDEKSNACRGNAGEDACYAVADKTQACPAGGQRETRDGSRNGFIHDAKPDRFCDATRDQNQTTRGVGLPDLLQTGLGALGSENCDRGGRRESSQPPSSGREEGRTLNWARLDSIEIYERANNDAERDGDANSYVYNIEVADFHTYIANGVVVHNCHHYVDGVAWTRVLDHFPNARGLGVTATPVRADGKGLGRHADGLFDTMILGPTSRELIQMKYLTEYRIYAPPNDIDLSSVTISASGDYSPPKLAAAVHKSHITGDIVEQYLRVTPGKLGMTFATDIESATEIAAAYRAAGVPAECVSGKTPDALRRDVQHKHQRGEIKQIVSVDLYGEGIDIPNLEVVSFGRPTASLGLYIQQFWRPGNPRPDKPHFTVLDHVGNVLRHGLPDAKREWSMDRRERRTRSAPDDVVLIKVCAKCLAVYERVAKFCPYCGEVPVPAIRSTPDAVDGDLAEMSEELLARLRGEIDKPLTVPYDATAIVVASVKKHHRERQSAQQMLRGLMSTWGGWRTVEGDDVAMQQRRFYITFGVDVLSAMALNKADAIALAAKIMAVLRDANVEFTLDTGE